jgi:hypothetical protein
MKIKRARYERLHNWLGYPDPEWIFRDRSGSPIREAYAGVPLW